MNYSSVITGKAEEVCAALPPEFIQTCICSPPYFQLRDYDHLEQIGNEDTPQQYADRLVQVFRGVRRCLRSDGTLWLNLGDTYARSPKKGRHRKGQSGKQDYAVASSPGGSNGVAGRFCDPKTPPKSLIGIPWRVAFALMDDGWILRNEVIWNKTNGMTESAHDRLTRAHEQVFLFAKSPDYYFDDYAIMEPTTDGKAMRQKRDVWTLGTANYKGAHFAVFPEKLIEPMILSATSEGGECDECGCPAVRQVERRRVPTRPGMLTKVAGTSGKTSGNRDPGRHITTVASLGFRGGCSCGLDSSRPQIVLDPFLGSGTTAVVANRLGRSCIGIEINPTYAKMAEERIRLAQAPAARG
jgi:DNA modification methylase